MAEQDNTGIGADPAEGSDQKAQPSAQAPAPRVSSDKKPGSLEITGMSMSGVLGDDIAKILQEVKLPERRDTAAPKQSESAKAFDTALGTVPEKGAGAQGRGKETAPAPAALSPQAPAQEEVPPENIRSVHTLKDDLQGIVRDQKMSVVRAASLEQDRRAHAAEQNEETPASAQRSKRTFAIVFSILMLLSLGAAALFGVYTVLARKSEKPAAPAQSSVLFSEQNLALSIDGKTPSELKQTIAVARERSNAALGSITRIIPVTAVAMPDGSTQQIPATLAQFLAAIGARAPESLMRALGSDFFFGIHTIDKNTPILIIPVVSYDRAFAGMLTWESTMNADLAPAFTAVPELTTDASGLPVRRTFQDLVMRNYDARALKDDSGTIELFYSFPTQNILVIAESPYSFPEILNRLQASREL